MTTAERTTIDSDPELWHGLTITDDWGGAQVRAVANVVGWVGNSPITDGLAAQLVLAFRPGAPTSPEDGRPFVLEQAQARRLRDLLNIATARGQL